MKNACVVVSLRSAVWSSVRNCGAKSRRYVPFASPFAFTIFLAIKRCRIAQARMYSGTSSAYMNIATFVLKKHNVTWTDLGQKSISCVSTDSGTFGWTATHVHRNTVVTQLH